MLLFSASEQVLECYGVQMAQGEIPITMLPARSLVSSGGYYVEDVDISISINVSR